MASLCRLGDMCTVTMGLRKAEHRQRRQPTTSNMICEAAMLPLRCPSWQHGLVSDTPLPAKKDAIADARQRWRPVLT